MEEHRFVALSSRVLAVATFNAEAGDWAAYVDAVPGRKHGQEYEEVARHGDKLDRSVATVLFPHLATRYKWRP